MKKIIFAIITLAMMQGCSVEQRFTRLLALHPELMKQDTIQVPIQNVVHDTVIMPYECQTATITISQLFHLDSIESSPAAPSTESENHIPSLTVETTHAGAALIPMGGGVVQLKAYTIPDTIAIHDTVTYMVDVPSVVYRTVTVNKIAGWQYALMYAGGTFLFCLILIFIVNILRNYF